MVSFRGAIRVLATLPLVGAMVILSSPAKADSQILCRSFAACSSRSAASAAYAQVYLQSFWNMTPGHNCTNYVAYRLTHQGRLVARPYGTNSASTWGGVARAAGIPVVDTPRAGDVAWWGPDLQGLTSVLDLGIGGTGNHVAMVEAVNADGSITISEDNLTGDFQWRRLSHGLGWPSGFIRYPQSDGSPTGSLDSVRATAPGQFTLEGRATDPDSLQTKARLLLSWGAPAGAPGAKESLIGQVYPQWTVRTTFVTGDATTVYAYALNNTGTPGASRVLLGSRVVAPYRTATTTSHRFADDTITAATYPYTTVKVERTATNQPQPTGTIVMKELLTTLSTTTLRASNNGTLTVRLPKLSRGTHAIRAYFRPTDAASGASNSASMRIVVR
jgi:surface antigen